MTVNDDLIHLQEILKLESEKMKTFAKQAKAEGDMEDYYFFHGQEGAYNYSKNLLNKIIDAHKLKGCKTAVHKTTRKTVRRA